MRPLSFTLCICLCSTLLPVGVCALAYYPLLSQAQRSLLLQKQDLVGIWKVSKRYQFPYPNPSELYKDSIGRNGLAGNNNPRDEILLLLHPDGTFDPCLEEVDGIDYSTTNAADLECLLGRGGYWMYRDQQLFLASYKPEDVADIRIQDLLFRGPIMMPPNDVRDCSRDNPANPFQNIGSPEECEIDDESSTDQDLVSLPIVPHGTISTGPLVNPMGHDNTFDEPILMERSILLGSFAMAQLVCHKRRNELRHNTASKTSPKFKLDTLYNRTFYLATAPHSRQKDESTATMTDIRVLQVTFYSNHTFLARGTEKILRGSYGLMTISDKRSERNHLWFQVSLYGTGRSVPGSVYSEGRLLTQEDRRGYIGELHGQPSVGENQDRQYSVYGNYYAGFDVQQAFQSNAPSLGTFLLQETDRDEDDRGVIKVNKTDNDNSGNRRNSEEDIMKEDPSSAVYDAYADLYDMGFDFLGDRQLDAHAGGSAGSANVDETGDEYDGHYDGDMGFEVDDYDYYADQLDELQKYYDDADYFEEMADYDILDEDDGSYDSYTFELDIDDLPFQ